MLSLDSPEFTRPKYSSMIFGLLPTAVMRVGVGMSVGIVLGRYGITGSIAIRDLVLLAFVNLLLL